MKGFYSIFLLTFTLPKSSPWNKGSQPDALIGSSPSSIPFLLKALHEASHEVSRQAFWTFSGVIGAPSLQEANCLSSVPLYVHTASPNCAECLQNKDDTNCWMWRLWFYSRNEALTATVMLQKIKNTRFTNISGCQVLMLCGNSCLCTSVWKVFTRVSQIVLQCS